MSYPSWFWRISLAVIFILLLVPIVTGVSSGLSPDTPWAGGQQAGTLPLWLQIWLMGVMTPMFFISFFFLHYSNEARVLVAGVIISHIPMAVDLFPVTVGAVGIIHIVCLSPAFYLLTKKRPRVVLKSAFGLWVHTMLFILAVSLAFDTRDAIRFIFLKAHVFSR